MYSNTTLGDLIEFLKTMNPEIIVKDGFGHPHSDRGNYDELAFDPMPESKIRDMLENAESAVGKTFDGWKGGEYIMDLGTPVYIGEFGNCGDPITPIHFKYWKLTGFLKSLK
jgi:hypothetical protein